MSRLRHSEVPTEVGERLGPGVARLSLAIRLPIVVEERVRDAVVAIRSGPLSKLTVLG